MKKFGFLIIAIVLLLLTGCGSTFTAIEEIEYDTLEEKIENKDNFILEVMQTGCSHCEEFTPRFRSVLSEYKIKAYSINLSNLTKEETKKLNKIALVTGTPTVLFFKKGKEETLYRLVGAASDNEVVKKLKSTGYIK